MSRRQIEKWCEYCLGESSSINSHSYRSPENEQVEIPQVDILFYNCTLQYFVGLILIQQFIYGSWRTLSSCPCYVHTTDCCAVDPWWQQQWEVSLFLREGAQTLFFPSVCPTYLVFATLPCHLPPSIPRLLFPNSLQCLSQCSFLPVLLRPCCLILSSFSTRSHQVVLFPI